MDKNILFTNSATKYVLNKLGLYPLSVIPINKERYIIVELYNKPTIAIMLKRNPLYTFSRISGEKGIGDSVNCSDISKMIQNKVESLYTLFPDGKIYTISIDDLLEKSHRWLNKEGKYIRSFSIHHYKRIKTTGDKN